MIPRIRIALRVLAGLALAAATPADARAQRVTGPFAGLFGGDKGEHTQALDFRAGVGTIYDTSLTATGDSPDPVVGFDPAPRLSQIVVTSLSYERRGDKSEFLIGGGSTARQYPDAQNKFATSREVGTTLNTHVSSKVVLGASAGVSYAPFFLLSPFAGPDGLAAAMASDAYGVVPQNNRTLNGALGVSDQYAKRSSIGGALTWRTTHFPDNASADLDAWSAKGTFDHRLTRSLSFRSSLGREQVQYKFMSLAPIVEDVVDVGLDYGREAALARRTSFSFFVKPSILRQAGLTSYRLNGSAEIARGFARTWSTSLAYTRSTEFVAGFIGPLFWDSLTGSINGLLTMRVQWLARVSAAHGEEGSGLRGAVMEYTGSSRLTIGLTRRIGAYGQYTYYHHEIPPGLTAIELQSWIARQRVSAGISLWLPLATETRAPSDPR
jgi:hypothetical protein